MKRFYFYCPKCGHEDRVDKLPHGTIGNIRDGYGTPIHHFECPECYNLDAGFMTYQVMAKSTSVDDMESYFKDVISMYQDIRGFAKHEME